MRNRLDHLVFCNNSRKWLTLESNRITIGVLKGVVEIRKILLECGSHGDCTTRFFFYTQHIYKKQKDEILEHDYLKILRAGQ